EVIATPNRGVRTNILTPSQQSMWPLDRAECHRSVQGRKALGRCAIPGHARNVMPLERLSPEDRLILWPDEVWPQDIGAVAVLHGIGLLDSDGRFQIEAVKRLIESRLHLFRRFRQLLSVPRRGLGGPL